MERGSFGKSILAILCFFIIISFGVNIFFYIINRNDTQVNKIKSMNDVESQIDSTLNMALNNTKGLFRLQYFDYNARIILLESNRHKDEKTNFENSLYMDNAISHIVAMDPVILRATIISTHGDVYSNVSTVSDDYCRMVVECEKRITKKIAQKPTYIKKQEYVINQKRYNIITAVYSILDYNGRSLSVLSIDIDYDAVSALIHEIVADQEGTFLIFNNDDNFFQLYCMEEDLKKSSDGDIAFIQNQASRINENGEINVSGKVFYLSQKLNLLSGWNTLYLKSDKQIFDTVDKELYKNIMILTAFLGGALLLSFWFAKMVSQPLDYMNIKISQDFHGTLSPVQYEGKYINSEIKNVMDSYNTMVDCVNEYVKKTILYEKNQRIAQSMILRYQINPHFLFNTLNTIASMGEIADSPEIIGITKNLTSIMQYNIRGNRFVTFGQEMDMVQAYLQIQKIRYQNTFEIYYDIEDRIFNIKIIKFIIQPFLENVFKHGFVGIEKNNRIIRITAYIQDEFLVIKIRDNGRGIGEQKLKELNNMLQVENSQTAVDEDSWSDRIGIQNVNIRLKDYYGNTCGVRIYSELGQWTEVELRLFANSSLEE